MTKTEAIQRAGSEADLARILNISRQAVNAWDGDTIPKRSLQILQLLKPSWFKAPPAAKRIATGRATS